MNFQNALTDLFNNQGNAVELTRKHHLNAQQIAALEAVSKRVSETMQFPTCSMRVC